MFDSKITLACALSAILAACTTSTRPAGSGMVEAIPIADNTRADLKALQGVRVFFAHQSVGGNILDGLASLAKETGDNIRIEPLDGTPTGPGIFHVSAGQNGHPDSKLRSFSEGMARLSADLPRVAVVKFCYVDFNPDTDVDALFSDYRSQLGSLRRTYPDVVFVHVTAPLTARPDGLKDRLKRLLGRSVWEDDANIRRALYNAQIRSVFKDEPIFDLARIESTRPNGAVETFTGRDGKTAAVLSPDYSLDGGHLNPLGRRVAATEFARVLAAAARNHKTANP